MHRQLFCRIAEAIRSGEIGGEARLPSTRTMANLLGVSRNTVLAAYDALVADDLIRGEPGSGMRVNRGPVVAGMHAIGIQRLLREAHYPAQTISFTDPDGNPMYLNI